MKWLPGQPVTYATERFKIRSLLPADVTDEYVGWWNDPEVQAGFQSPPRNWTAAQAKDHIRIYNNKDNFQLGIFDIMTGKMIGFISVQLDAGKRIAIPVLCIGDKAYWGQRVSIEVAAPLFEFFFDEVGVDKIEGRVKGNNKASFAILKHFKFKNEGCLRKRMKGLDVDYVDLHVWGLLKEEWQARRKKAKA